MPSSVVVTGTAGEAVRAAVVAKLTELLPAATYAVDAEAQPQAEELNLIKKRFGVIVAAVDDANVARKDYGYHVRAFVSDRISPESAATTLAEQLTNPALKRFVSTRQDAASAKPVSFLGAVRQGLAQDGGLFVPTALPAPFPPEFISLLSQAPFADYAVLAQAVLERLVDRNEVPPGVLQAMIARAYDVEAWSNEVARCPVADVTFEEAKAQQRHVALSQQFCGPTSAFKDFALQLFPQWFDLATTVCQDEDDAADESPSNYLILAATSGDTGGAAINGFVRGAPHIKVMVLYPTKGVSPVQRLQMLSMNGGNVRVVAVDDDFDFCQTTVKRIFNDASIRQKIASDASTRLSSANSINWGRLLPQLVYYFHNYASLVRDGKLAAGEPMDVCVPTGNFGNILACYIARRLGLPVGRLVLASNCNDVLHDFVTTGVYDISARRLELTASPSIDILKASNVERFLHIVTNGDGAAVAQMMSSLADSKKFDAPAAVKDELQRTFWSGRCDEATCRAAIKRTFEQSGVVVDPHTAVAMEVARQYMAAYGLTRAKVLLVSSTAHWAKFPEPVAEGLGVAPPGGLKGNAATADDIRALYATVAEAAGGKAAVSVPLAKIFESRDLAEQGPRLPAAYDDICADLLRFAGANAAS
eukprot:CAMPEP_0174852380 /NCGR_PEP_ID=MMETSP1114-20130205/25331_1 /TAXON_ID=312471 /ORGANISM="Neobodo designis, Strain CCAP 1951/1" /LENGTH=646 /DNA_ID=CAMNT_0016086967 /DNA_START=66 /DNA_END=2006 /DNA_ORIENTATION=-